MLSKQYKEKLSNMHALSLITSCGCNLNCEYCLIAQNRALSTNSENLQLNTINALKDGTFLKNVNGVLKYFNIDRKQITNIDFWGQEPTLTLKYYTQNIKDWLNNFPCLERFFFSTNGMDFGEDIFDFFAKIDENANGRSILVRMQISYDGEFSTNNIRNANNEKILNNILKVLEKMNTYVFKNVNIEFHIHAVLSFQLISMLDTTEKIYKYFKEMDEFCYNLISNNHNPKVFIVPGVQLGLENPYNGSTEDGLNITNFIKKCFLVNCNDFHCTANPIEHFLEALICVIDRERLLPAELRLGEQCLDIANQGMASVSNLLACGSNNTEFKIMYDGTIVPCQNMIFNTKEEPYSATDDVETYIKKSLANNHLCINPLTDSDETISKSLERFFVNRNDAFEWVFHQTCTLMYLLAKYNQIDREYLVNHKKLLAHAYISITIISCMYNNFITTGSLFLRSTGTLRVYCNGLIDLLQDRYDRLRNKEINKERIKSEAPVMENRQMKNKKEEMRKEKPHNGV